LTETEQRILCALENQTLGSKELLTLLGYRQKTGNYKAAMEKLSALNLIEYTNPGKPNSRLQKYRLTPKGRTLLI
jgi:ATP-dependent DNA helicase RecG